MAVAEPGTDLATSRAVAHTQEMVVAENQNACSLSKSCSERNWKSKDVVAGLRQLCGDFYIDNHRLKRIKEIGQGAYASVYLCALTMPGGQRVRVAAKQLHNQLVKNQRDLDDFCMEANVLRKLQHSCILQFIGVGTATGQLDENSANSLLIVSEYMGGGTLQKTLVNQMLNPHRKIYSTTDALRWCMQTARAIKYLHAAKPKIIHRDLKPDNIFLSVGSSKVKNAKLGDFGLHVRVSRGEGPDNYCAEDDNSAPPMHSELLEQLSISHSVSLTTVADSDQLSYNLTGQTGSYVYMAPEVYKGLPYNEKADVYSFGVIMYELLTRSMLSYKLSTPENLLEFVDNVCNHGARPDIPSYVPWEAAEIICGCWQHNPTQRPTMSEVVAKLRPLAEAQPEEKTPKCTCSIM